MDVKKKNPVGRPKKKNPVGRPSKYKNENCEIILELMREGASKVEVCAALGISFETLYDWTDEESPRFKKEFSGTLKKGELLSQAWWEKEGRKNLKDRDFNFTGWYMNMKNRFRKSPVKWSDKSELEHSGKIHGITVTTNVID